ncbi:MAG: lipopolysaccharide transport periplasmic protein LptA [Burkholderiaceae bacterium]|jgi:lipopolysaccharide export system protein LptA|nr:lipopolysaccharide transport periplasmic protein LptA [Burkholderiaceae bacterium]
MHAWQAALLTLLLAAPAWAERTDRDQPMQIESDALRYEEQKQLSTFTGHVVVNKGTIVMRGEQLQVRQDGAGNQRGTIHAGAGQRAFFRQKREGLNEYIEAEGDTIDYDSKTDIVRITGRAQMRRLAGAKPQDQVSGSVIVYNNVTEVYTVDGSARASDTPAAAGKRVTAVLAPRRSASAAAGAASESTAPLQSSRALRK